MFRSDIRFKISFLTRILSPLEDIQAAEEFLPS